MRENDSSFFHSLRLMNLDIVILEYGHDMSSYGYLRNEKLHMCTPSITVRRTDAKNYKQIRKHIVSQTIRSRLDCMLYLTEYMSYTNSIDLIM